MDEGILVFVYCIVGISNASRVPIRSLAPDATDASNKRSLHQRARSEAVRSDASLDPRDSGNGKLYLQLLKIKLHRACGATDATEPVMQSDYLARYVAMSQSRVRLLYDGWVPRNSTTLLDWRADDEQLL
jgi:hypothetical protein